MERICKSWKNSSHDESNIFEIQIEPNILSLLRFETGTLQNESLAVRDVEEAIRRGLDDIRER